MNEINLVASIVTSVGFLVVALVHISLFSILPMFYGAFYAGTKQESIEKMLLLSNVKKEEIAVDIGSGDGRIAIALAKAIAKVYGYEINPMLVWWSRYRIRKAGLQDKVSICQKNFWEIDLSPFDIVAVFAVPGMMGRLEKKVTEELKPKARVILNGTLFPNWKCAKKIGPVTLYIKS